MRYLAKWNDANRVGLTAIHRTEFAVSILVLMMVQHAGMRHHVTMKKVITACRLNSGRSECENPKNSDKCQHVERHSSISTIENRLKTRVGSLQEMLRESGNSE